MSGLGGNPQSSSEPDPIQLLTISTRYNFKPHSIKDCHFCALNLGRIRRCQRIGRPIRTASFSGKVAEETIADKNTDKNTTYVKPM